MKTSAAGIALIKEHEGKRLKAYLCPAGVWTIGYGHTTGAGSPSVQKGMMITEAEADAIFARDIGAFERGVLRLVKVPLTQGQFDALVSFEFNTGKLSKSTLLRKLNAGAYDAVPAELMRWTKAKDKKTGKLVDLPGLVRRRREEAALWRDLDETATAGRADIEEVAEPPAKPKTDTPISRRSRIAQGSVVAGGSGAALGIMGVAEVADELLKADGYISNGTWLGIAAAILVVAGTAYALYARAHDGGWRFPWQREAA
jgi:GH24 family phage-related lysozyme (muramidase)